VQSRVEDSRIGLDALGGDLAGAIGRALSGAGPALARGESTLARISGAMLRALMQATSGVERDRSALLAALSRAARAASARIDAVDAKLRGLDPRAPLALGFALLWQGDGGERRLVRETSAVADGSLLEIELKDGGFLARREDSPGGGVE
jgi:exonuclease VII large subunit